MGRMELAPGVTYSITHSQQTLLIAHIQISSSSDTA